jgi:SDR family mycofactocin-dependent oxidoreductase
MPQVEGKVALITGAARGQGRSHALTLAREGADVILVDVAAPIEAIPYELGTLDELKQTASEVEALGRRAIAVQGDTRDQKALDGAVARGIEELGKIDIVVANSGVWSIGNFWELSDEEWEVNIDVNLTGAWRTVRAVTPHLIERGAGSIIMVGSTNATEPGPQYAHYCAAKAGVLALMRNVAFELGPHGVRCNAISPGAIDTLMNKWPGSRQMMTGKENATLEDIHEAIRHYPVLRGRRFIPPTSTSNAVLWLASDAAADITGINVPVDAGHLVIPSYNTNPQ